MAPQQLRDALRGVDSWQALSALFVDRDSASLDTTTVDQLWRLQSALPGEPDCRIAYLSDQTLEPLSRHVTASAAIDDGLRVAGYCAPYGQHYQQVLDEGSSLLQFRPDLIVLQLSLSAVAPDLAKTPLAVSEARRHEAIGQVVEHVRDWVSLARARTDAMLLVSNFPRPMHPAAGIADHTLAWGETEFHAALNLELLRALRADARVGLLDLELALARCGLEQAGNPQLHYLARIPWSEAATRSVAGEIRRHVRSVRGHVRKALVVDLDNTLWGGVLGEEGVWGIRVGDGDPESRSYADVQHRIKSLAGRGVILAICSKNNEQDVLEVFAQRPDMPLKLEDFAATRINWASKADNLLAIAEELNIGVDSLVFIDDSPLECGLMRAALPQVRTLQLPEDPATRADLLAALPYFDVPRITGDDQARQRQYRDNALRRRHADTVGDLNAFLAQLDTSVLLEVAAERHVPRVHQLFGKTNQFNLTTQRYSLADVEKMLVDPACLLRVATVSDRFGELGLVAVYLLRHDGGVAVLDSFLMSCRAMGRGIETALMNALKQDAFETLGCQVLEACYRPTRKNVPVQAFLDEQGFQRVDEASTGERLYRLEAPQSAWLDCPGITLERREGVDA